MNKFIKFISDRSKEPSTWAGIAGALLAIGQQFPPAKIITSPLAAVSSGFAIFLKETKDVTCSEKDQTPP